MTNAEIADAFAELADRLALTDEKPFRYMAYRNAATTLRELGHAAAALSRQGRLREVDGIGPAIEEKVAQLIETGTFPALERARQQVDDTLLELTRLPGIGPATARKVHAATDGEGFESLLERASAGTLQVRSGITRKVIDALAGEAARRASGAAPSDGSLSGVPRDPGTGVPQPGPWFRRDQAWTQFTALAALVEGAHPAALRVELLGDYARGAELVGGLDVLVDGPALDEAREAATAALDEHGFSVVAVPGEPLAVVTPAGMPCSITFAPATPELRSQLAGPPAWSAVSREPGADSVPIELRDAVLHGTWTLADAPRDLVTCADLRGELHGHSDWSDGRATILDMARAARERGDSYYLVSDHSAPYAMVGGLDEARLLAQAEEIARVNEQLQREHQTAGAAPFVVLHGSEVEVLADGTLGLPDSALARLDWVVASIHVAQRQSAEAILARMERVVANPLVDAIGHPTSRRLLRRERTALDVDALIAMAAASQVVLEINANPDRLDLDSEQAARALAAGVRLAINCDAHRPANLDLRSHGVAVARRAGARPAEVVNCLAASDLLARRRRDH